MKDIQETLISLIVACMLVSVFFFVTSCVTEQDERLLLDRCLERSTHIENCLALVKDFENE